MFFTDLGIGAFYCRYKFECAHHIAQIYHSYSREIILFGFVDEVIDIGSGGECRENTVVVEMEIFSQINFVHTAKVGLFFLIVEAGNLSSDDNSERFYRIWIGSLIFF